MRYLFVHQNYPGQYLHYLRHIAADPRNEIVFISEPNGNAIENVRRLLYPTPKPSQDPVHEVARDFDLAARRAQTVASMCENLKRLGFTPDIVIGHHGWGELLNIVDVWPNAPMLGYFEFYYSTAGQDVGYDSEFPIDYARFARVRAMNVVNHLAIALHKDGQTPTEWQLTRYPEWARHGIRLIREGAHLDVCKPDPAVRKRDFSIGSFHVKPGEKLVTYVARNLEPYRGFHTMMRALPRLTAARKDLKVVMVGGDEVSYGAKLIDTTWREHFQQRLAGQYDTSRVLMPGQIPYAKYLELLQRSDAHVYLSYPFVASWSLREALACGCAVVGADVDPIKEFVTHDRNGLIVNGLRPDDVADAALRLLEDGKLNRRLRAGARKYAEQYLPMENYLAEMDRTVRELVG